MPIWYCRCCNKNFIAANWVKSWKVRCPHCKSNESIELKGEMKKRW